MKKLFLLAALALPLSISLTSCGNTDTVSLSNSADNNLPKYTNVVAAIGDVTSNVTATKSVDKDTGAIKWSIGTPNPATFNFTALPGSSALNILGYRITKDTIDGTDVTPTDNSFKSIFIYVPSGYTCTNQATLAAKNQSCDGTATGTVPATGAQSSTLSLGLSNPLGSYVVAKDGDVFRYTDLEFLAVSARNERFVIEVKGVISQGIKTE